MPKLLRKIDQILKDENWGCLPTDDTMHTKFIDVASIYVLIMWITNCNGTFVCGSWTRPWFTFGAIVTIGANYPRWTSFSPVKVWISWAGLHFDGNVFTRTIAVNYVGLGPILAIAQSIRIFLCLIKLLSNLIFLSKSTNTIRNFAY